MCDVRRDRVIFTHQQLPRRFVSERARMCVCVCVCVCVWVGFALRRRVCASVVIMMNVFALPGLRSTCLRLTSPCVGGDVSRPSLSGPRAHVCAFPCACTETRRGQPAVSCVIIVRRGVGVCVSPPRPPPSLPAPCVNRPHQAPSHHSFSQ